MARFEIREGADHRFGSGAGPFGDVLAGPSLVGEFFTQKEHGLRNSFSGIFVGLRAEASLGGPEFLRNERKKFKSHVGVFCDEFMDRVFGNKADGGLFVDDGRRIVGFVRKQGAMAQNPAPLNNAPDMSVPAASLALEFYDTTVHAVDATRDATRMKDVLASLVNADDLALVEKLKGLVGQVAKNITFAARAIFAFAFSVRREVQHGGLQYLWAENISFRPAYKDLCSIWSGIAE